MPSNEEILSDRHLDAFIGLQGIISLASSGLARSCLNRLSLYFGFVEWKEHQICNGARFFAKIRRLRSYRTLPN